MKKLLLLTTLIVFFTSCTKSVVDISPRTISGTWVVTDAARSDGYGWQYFRSGLEEGVFDFYRDGS
ncbi:MAG: hypothetical protein ACN4EP_15610, partial [Sediminibacterium sp.]